MVLVRDEWKTRIDAAVDDLRELLVATSHAIHADPEILFGEQRAAARLADALERGGLAVERGVGGLPTAFRAELRGRRAGPTVAVLAEYDALPGLGHACGHNIIAASALGAGLALARGGTDFGGRVLVVGTPAEEGGGGKIILAEAGVFDDVDAAIMMHPSRKNIVFRGSLASSRIDVTFHGRAAHAAAYPEQGINALEAVIHTFVAINGWRLHMRADARVHGIITHGGDAVNIIPARAAAKFSVRALDRRYQRRLVAMLRQSAEGATQTTGARLEWQETLGYDNMISNPTIAQICRRNMEALGLEVVEPAPDEGMGSTDMGDISQIIPAIHAYFAIGPATLVGHTPEMAAAAISEAGDAAVVDGAKALAMTAADLLAEPALLEQAQTDFRALQEQGRVAGRDAWRANRQLYGSGGQ
ncbi:MAG: M20 family metallopeptidase [Chloroflexi bacterium]|nr:M20 family metallopeptidase [Chloroflexota bacterium]